MIVYADDNLLVNICIYGVHDLIRNGLMIACESFGDFEAYAVFIIIVDYVLAVCKIRGIIDQ